MPAPCQGPLRDTTSCHRIRGCCVSPHSLSIRDITWLSERSLTLSSIRSMCPNFTFNRDLIKGSVNAGWEQMRWADWAQVLPHSSWRKHLLFQRDLKREKKKQLPGEFPPFYFSHTETRCYNRPTAGHPKITAGNVRLQSARWGQERWAAHSVTHHHFFPTTHPPPQAVRQDGYRETESAKKEHTAMCTRGWLRYSQWWTVLQKKTSYRHIGSLRIGCDSCRVYRDQNSPNQSTSSWWWQPWKLGQKAMLALNTDWLHNEASSVTINTIKPKTQ